MRPRRGSLCGFKLEIQLGDFFEVAAEVRCATCAGGLIATATLAINYEPPVAVATGTLAVTRLFEVSASPENPEGVAYARGGATDGGKKQKRGPRPAERRASGRKSATA